MKFSWILKKSCVVVVARPQCDRPIGIQVENPSTESSFRAHLQISLMLLGTENCGDTQNVDIYIQQLLLHIAPLSSVSQRCLRLESENISIAGHPVHVHGIDEYLFTHSYKSLSGQDVRGRSDLRGRSLCSGRRYERERGTK